MNKLLGAVAVAAILAAANAAQASVLYSNNFESASTAGITGVTSITTAPGGHNYLGQLALGSTSTLTVGTSGYTNVILSFDLYTINSLDGDGTSLCCGPDIFTLKANAATLLSKTFSNNSGWTQSYGGAGSAGGTGSDYSRLDTTTADTARITLITCRSTWARREAFRSSILSAPPVNLTTTKASASTTSW